MKSNVATVQEEVKGIDNPKDKKEVLDPTKDHKVSKDVMADLEQILDSKYKTEADIRKKFSGK